jgi:hypothetical protein
MTTFRVHGPDRSDAPVILWRSVMDGGTYQFMLSYLERWDAWHLQIALTDGTVLLDGERVTEGVDILAAYTDSRLPPGELRCVDTRGLGANPTRRDWRERHLLTYTAASTTVVDNNLRVVEVIEGEA